MADGRRKNNLSPAQRRAIAKTANRKKPKREASELEAAKNVLRRHGKVVAAAHILNPSLRDGTIYVDGRRLTEAEVVAAARDIVRREKERNAELRKQHGLTKEK